MKTDLVEYIKSKGIPFHLEKGGEELVIQCPICDKEKLSINTISNIYQCFHCRAENPGLLTAKGHISQLKEFWGDIVPISSAFKKKEKDVDFTDLVDKYHTTLLDNKKAYRYLLKRGIREESIERFKLGFVRKDSQNWIAIPCYEKNVPKLIKYRKSIPDENTKLDKYRREKGGKSILFNGDIIEKYDEILILESEFDAIALIQEGYENVVASTGGAGTLKSEWWEQLVMKKKLYLCFDPDSAGQRAARDIWATRLGVDKCWNVFLPEGLDVNEYFQKFTRKNFRELLENAERFKVEGVFHISDVLFEMYEGSQDREGLEIFPLPWKFINKLLGGGLVKKRLTVLGGSPGVGKTSFAMQVCYHFAKAYDIPCLYFCLEMPETELVRKVIQLHKDLVYDEARIEDALFYLPELGHFPLYFGYKSKLSPDIFYHTMKEVRDRYGVQLGVFDNLQLMVRTGKEADIAIASKMFKDMVMELNIMFILISQPRKLEEDSQINYYDLKGSSAIPADADEVILLNRKRLVSEETSSSFAETTYVIVDKSRFAPGGRCKLSFDGAKARFNEMVGSKGRSKLQ